MAMHITDPEIDRLVRQLAEARGISQSDAIKLAVQRELKNASLIERLRPLQDRILSQLREDRPKTDAEWKAFYDDLEGEPAPPAGERDTNTGTADMKRPPA